MWREYFKVFSQNFLTIYKDREARGASVPNFSADSSKAVCRFNFLTVRCEDLPHIDFVLAVEQDLLVDRVYLLMVDGSARNAIHRFITINPMLSRNDFNCLDKLIDIFLSYVDMSCHNNALLGALLNIYPHGVEDVRQLVAGKTLYLEY